MHRLPHRPRRRLAARAVACALAVLATVLPVATANAAEILVTGDMDMRTNGDALPGLRGDFYAATGSSTYVSFTIPCSWPSTAPVYIDILSPEISTASSGDTITGTADSVEFELHGPLGGSLTPAPGTGVPGSYFSYAPTADPDTWIPFWEISATQGNFACGTYVVRSRILSPDPANPGGGDDDENFWALRVGTDNDLLSTNPPPANADDFDLVPGTDDEIVVGLVQASLQNSSAATACQTLWEYVAPGTNPVAFHNFSMGTGRVRYYAPGDVVDDTALSGGILGSVSADDEWNGGSALSRGTGDVIAAPTPGWWAIVTCVGAGNQFIQEGQVGVPAYAEHPPTPVLAIAKDDAATVVGRGRTLTYDIDVDNTSAGATAGAATGVTITDTLPANVTYVSCTFVPAAAGTCGESGGTVTGTVTGPLVAGETVRLRVVATVDATASGSIVNIASVAADDSFGNTLPTLTATDTDTVPDVDLSITKADDVDPALSGGTVTYTIETFNAGPDSSTGVTVTDTLPAGLSFVSAAGSGWTCGAAGQVVTCTRTAHAAGAFRPFTVVAAVTATGGTLSNTATVSTTSADSDPTNDSATETTAVESRADLAISKSHIGNFSAGSTGSYQIVVSNPVGPSPAAGPITVVDTLPAGLSYSSATGTGWTCSALGATVTCTRAANLPVGASTSFVLTVDVAATAASSVTNTATVSSASIDSNAANDTATDPTTVETGQIGGVVFHDANGNGTQQPGELPFPGVTVTVTGPVTRTDTTDASGAWSVVGLPAGTYTVTAVGPPKYAVTTMPYPVSVTLPSGGTRTVDLGMEFRNNPPVADNEVLTVNEDTAGNVNVLTGDTDADGDPLTVASFTQGTKGSVSCTSAGVCTYTPNADATGADSFTYVVDDGDGGQDTGTVSVTITPVNDAPSFTGSPANTSQTIPEDGIVAALQATDPDAGDTLTFTVEAGALPPGITLLPDGTFTGIAPTPGTYTATIRVTDSGGLFDDTVLVITVTPGPNEMPIADDDTLTTAEDTPGTVDVLAGDTDPDGDPLVIGSFTDPANGTVACSPSVASCLELVYTPDPDFTGTDTFDYVLSDNQGGTDTGTVTVTVTPVNDPPVYTAAASNTQQTTPVGGTLQDLLATDVEGDTLTFTLTGGTLPPGITLTAAGALTGNATAPGTYQVTVQVDDGNGGTDTTTLDITVGGPTANTPPDASNDTLTTAEDSPGSVTVLANDSDVDLDTLTVTAFTQGGSGTVTCTTAGVCTYTPGANFQGSDSFTYTVSDGSGGSDTATVAVTVTPVNDGPVAVADSDTTDYASPVTIDVVANDTDVDGDTLTVTGSTTPAHGTVSCAGTTCTYTPDAGFSGTDAFTYTVSDPSGATDTTTVAVVVGAAPNSPPLAGGDIASVVTGESVTISVLGNDTDPDGDPLSVSAFTQGAHGTVTCTAAGVCTYTAAAGYTGPDAFTYTISDGRGGTATGTVSLAVEAAVVPPAPPGPGPRGPITRPRPEPPTLPATGAAGSLPAGLVGIGLLLLGTAFVAVGERVARLHRTPGTLRT